MSGKITNRKLGLLPVQVYQAPSEGISSSIVLNAIVNATGADEVTFGMYHRRGATFNYVINRKRLPVEDYLPSQEWGPVKLPLGGLALEPGDGLISQISFGLGADNPTAKLQALCSGLTWVTWFTALEAAAFKGKDKVSNITMSVFEIEE